MQKPKVEHIEGLSPAISIEQRSGSGTPRSTVATVTEIYDYLRLLYTHIGLPHCPICGKPLVTQSAQAITERLLKLKPGLKMTILSPVVQGRKGEHREILENLRKDGFIRARIDGETVMLDEEELPVLSKTIRHTIEAVIDRLITGKIDRSRLTDSVETALRRSDGTVNIRLDGDDPDFVEEKFCEKLACPDCGVSYGELAPRNFSFNSPYGACPECNGLGITQYMDPEKVIPDPSKSIANGAIPNWRRGPRHLIIYYNLLLRKAAEHLGDPGILTTPFNKLAPEIQKFFLEGSGKEKLTFDFRMHGKKFHWEKPFEGVLENLKRRMNETESDSVRERLAACLSPKECPVCRGARLNPTTLGVTVGGKNISEFNALSVEDALKFLNGLELDKEAGIIASDVLKEITSRLTFLKDVGLSYLTLNRVSSTLSGGEAQRIRLATQIGSSLVGVLYILDEPSIGLHQRDNNRLISTLKHLRDIGNTLIVVEHDEDTMMAADQIVDIGPGAGEHGGELIAQGTAEEIMACPASITGAYLSGRRGIPVPAKRKAPTGFLTVRGAREHNLKGIDVSIPLGVMTVVTGVSGSGKSSLVNEIIYKTLQRDLNRAHTRPGDCDGLSGIEQLDKVIAIDQSPIGRTPRSNPATYTGLFDMIRKVFAATPEAKARGYKENRFSFNVRGGRCESCSGDGILRIEMHFLADIYVPCEVCKGKRYNRETLEVTYKGKSIADVLDMTVEEALHFFDAYPRISRKLQTLYDVGLGYIKLGQPSTTLSGGEAQRVKLATELSRASTGKTFYVLDEPTTGLHMADCERLVGVLRRLAEGGNSVLIIEHNLDVIKACDHIIDLGPEGGDGGGTLVCQGTPEEVASCEHSYTGQYLKPVLERSRRVEYMD